MIVLFLGEMLTALAMGHLDDEIEKAVVLALFVPLIISSGWKLRLASRNARHSRDGSQGTDAQRLVVCDAARIFSGLLRGVILGAIGFERITG